jgi:vacuolar-type H+-ATPase subunit F/Vma7
MEETRQVFLGEAALATGFRLAGFEVHPDAGIEELESMLDQLRATRTPAFVVIDQRLAETPSRRLDEVRAEGGRILITQVPSLTEPDAMRSSVDDRINQLLGIEEPSE